MRIALVHNLPSGGAKRHTFEQVKELARRGHWVEELTFSTADATFMPLRDHVRSVHVHPLDWRALMPISIPGVGPYVHLWQNAVNIRRLSAASHALAGNIDGQSFDVVLAKDCMFTVAPFVLRYLATSSVFQAHSLLVPGTAGGSDRKGIVQRLITEPPQNVHRALVHRAWLTNVRAADLVLANSEFTRGRLHADAGVNAAVLYPGVDAVAFCPVDASREKYVLSVGTLASLKGHDLVIDAIARVDSAIRPALTIAAANGSTVERERLVALAASSGVRLSIVNARATADMAQLYARAVATVSAAVGEALGLSPLESMACGTPAIVVNAGGLVETVRHGETGLVVERNAEAISAAIEIIISDRSLAERMGRRGRAYVLAEWTWERAVDRLEVLLRSACMRRPVPEGGLEALHGD